MEANQGRFFPLFLAVASWSLAVLALAGPAWERLPQPVLKQGTDTVFLWVHALIRLSTVGFLSCTFSRSASISSLWSRYRAILEANSINQDTYKFLKISMNPINMGYTIPIKSQTITPSYNNMMKAIHEALKTNDVLKSNYSFSFVIKKIKSYQELAVNWGQNINLQQLLGITPDYKPQKNIILIDINQSFFSIIMDMPESLSTDPQVLQQLDKLAFINSIQFGRKVILVIESNIISINVSHRLSVTIDIFTIIRCKSPHLEDKPDVSSFDNGCFARNNLTIATKIVAHL